jgi:hypothetical protein
MIEHYMVPCYKSAVSGVNATGSVAVPSGHRICVRHISPKEAISIMKRELLWIFNLVGI